jgi:hypothetical protein
MVTGHSPPSSRDAGDHPANETISVPLRVSFSGVMPSV